MNILAFDSSLSALSVAVARGHNDAWLVSEAWETRTGHAERLLPMIGEVMGEAGIAFSAIDRVAVTIGPGSFTGVRVGVAAARGLALALGRPAIGFTNLAVMAHEAARLLPGDADRLLAVAIDAGGGLNYFQLFAGERGACPPLLLAAEAAAAVIGRRHVVLVGSGADAVAAAIAAAGGKGEAALRELLPRASALASLAAAGAHGPVRPLYLRPHGAKPPTTAVAASQPQPDSPEGAAKGASAGS
jgi:tRNA threonylcarbamoyladenosine biosynthesis protein TsaB